MADNKVNEAAWNLTRSLSETNQAIADSAVAAQERNAKFAQSVFENSTELLKSHTESTRALMQELMEQPEKEQSVLQTVVDSAVAAQERNMRLAQSTFENGIEVLKSHTQSTRTLMQTLVGHSQRQQEAFQTLAHESVNAYTDFFSAPLAYYQQTWETAESIARKGVETAQRTTRQGMEEVQKATRQAQKAARSATE